MNREELIKRMDQGKRTKFVFFWGHRPKVPGVLDASSFSQWFPSPFEVDGVRYATAEHWMMREKARLFGDADAMKAIEACGSPAQAKALGRKVRGFDDTVWGQHRVAIVVAGSVHKFRQNPELGAVLARTGTKVLVEARPPDRIWGIGLAATDARARNPRAWRGENLLGFALMEARDAL